MTLSGRRIVVTRAPHQSADLIHRIEAMGGIAVSYPCIDIGPPDDVGWLDANLKRLSTFDWVIFTSSNTVKAVHTRLLTCGLSFDWSSVRVGAVGSKTSQAIADIFGIDADFVPDDTTGSGLAHTMPLTQGQAVLVPQSNLADTTITDVLTKRGASVTQVDAYQTVVGTGGANVPAMIEQNMIDALTFTSGSTVRYFMERIHPTDARHIPAICIGSTTSEVAIEIGFQHTYYPVNYSISEMITLLVELFDEVKNGNS